jgi:hypothetical protein
MVGEVATRRLQRQRAFYERGWVTSRLAKVGERIIHSFCDRVLESAPNMTPDH